MSFEAESNSELTVIIPAYQLHFRFPVQNKIFCRTPEPAYLAVLPVLVIFCPLGPMVRRISKSLKSNLEGGIF